MARGSSPGERRGGRKPGIPNKGPAKPRAIKAAAEQLGYAEEVDETPRDQRALPVDFEPRLTPLEYLLRIMRDPDEKRQTRIFAAVQAAPYCHPKYAAAPAQSDDRQVIVEIHRFAPPLPAAE